jgi:oligopeptide transport system ATP-binding protein
MEMAETFLVAKDLKKYFPIVGGFFSKAAGFVHAVDGISFQASRGKTLGLVGESGCGKTTAGKTILKLVEPTSGEIWYNGIDITHYTRGQMKGLRREIQIIFQDPFSSLNPRITVGGIVGAAIEIHHIATGKEKEDIIASLLKKVGLQPEHMRRYPHEFSGGQRQRIGIARALAANPKLIVADEPVSALDVSIRAQIINLLEDLQDELGLTYIIISHDLSVISHISDEIAVMYLGKIMEMAPRREIYSEPLHPYTETLLSAIPIPDPTIKKKRIILKGEVPSPIHPPSGCRFHPRCPRRFEPCDHIDPEFKRVKGNHFVACHLG